MLGAATDRLVPARDTLRPRWVFGPAPDLVMALGWAPVFLGWHLLGVVAPGTGDTRLQQGVALALLISFLHQPLTFGLVYGDRRQFILHRRLFLWAPVVALAVGLAAAVRNWWIVVPVAALWNLQHTLQQRYGVERIYSGKAGYGSARLDRAVAYVPMAMVLLAMASMPSLSDLVQRSGLDPRNAQGVALLGLLRPGARALLVVAAAGFVGVVLLVVRQELAAGQRANPAKWLYQASSLAMLAAIVVDPIAGFIAYVTAHAVEYAVIVDRTAKRRYGGGAWRETESSGPSFLGRLAAGSGGRVAFFTGIVALAFAVNRLTHGTVFNVVVLSVGALHFTYDAVIWKLRKPALAKEFDLARP